MSDDIVKRLRVQANRRSGCAHMMSDGSIKWHPMLDEAADEIERLNAENKRLRAELAAEREKTADYGKQIDRLADEIDWGEDEVVAQEKALEEVEAERDALRALLREALEPFAKWCDEMELECPTLRDDACVASDITMADVRRARAVYEKIKGGGDE